MADIVKIIDSKQAFDDLTRLSTQLDGMQTQINNLSNAAVKMNVSLGGIKTPANLQKEIDAIAISQERVRVATLKREQAELRLKDVSERIAKAAENRASKEAAASAKEEAAIAKKSTTYYKLQAALTRLKKEYQDLALKQNLGISISAKEEARLTSLTAKITKLDAALKKTDAGMGVHTRSVGNYGKAFDSLGFSVAQMTRESPAFLISMNTGFMALSNNIPIFVDEINKLAVANKALAAEGKPQVSIWKKVAGALFSWQSLISMGIVLLTVYGGKLVEMASAAIKGANNLDILASKQEDINKMSGESIAKFTGLIAVIKDVNKSEKDRLGAMEDLKAEYPDFNAAILTEEENTNLVSIAIENYITKLGKKAKAQAAMTLLQEKYAEQIAIEEKARQKIAEITGEENTTLERQKEISNELQGSLVGLSKQRTKGGAAALKLRDVNNALEDQKTIQDEINKLLDIYVDNVDFSIKAKDKETKSKNKSTKASKEEEKYLFGSIGYLDDIIKLYNDLLKRTTDPKNREFLVNQIKQTEDLKKSLLELREEKDTIVNILPKADSVNLDEFTNNLVDKFKLSKRIVSDELAKFLENPNMDISEFEDKLSDIAEAVEAMNERMKESFEQFSDTTNMFFDNRIEKLEQDRDANEEYFDNLIGLAEGNDDEQERLAIAKEARDKELREKQNETARKQAAFNKTLAIAGIAMKLGETIMAHKLAAAELNAVSLGTLGTIYQAIEIPLSIALAAAQTAAIISAPVPKFKDGTFNAPKGLAIVGDGGKHEFIEDRFGNIMQTPKTDTLVNLRGGERIHKDIDSLISSKGYDSNDIYKQTILASLASERGISTYRLEKVMDKSLKDLDSKIVNGIQKGFRNVNFNNHTKIDFRHAKYINDRL